MTTETTTMISARRGHVLELDGRVPRAEAIDRAAAYWRREMETAQANLAVVERGDAQVTWWRGEKELAAPGLAEDSEVPGERL